MATSSFEMVQKKEIDKPVKEVFKQTGSQADSSKEEIVKKRKIVKTINSPLRK